MSPFQKYPRIPTGIALALLVGIVMVGGAERIHAFCIRLVPLMGGLFLFCCILILGKNIAYVPEAVGLMLRSAVSSQIKLIDKIVPRKIITI